MRNYLDLTLQTSGVISVIGALIALGWPFVANLNQKPDNHLTSVKALNKEFGRRAFCPAAILPSSRSIRRPWCGRHLDTMPKT
jgi:hypothetical protein